MKTLIQYSFFMLMVLVNAKVMAQKPELVVPTGHGIYINKLLISPNNKYLASTDYTFITKIWDIKLEKEIRTLKGKIVFSSDWKFYALKDPNDTILSIYDFYTGNEIQRIYSLGNPIFSFSADNNYIGICDKLNNVQLWHINTNQLYKNYQISNKSIYKIFSNDLKYLACINKDSVIEIYDVFNNQKIKNYDKIKALSLSFSSDNKFLTIETSRSIKYSNYQIINFTDNYELLSLRTNEVAVSNDNKLLIEIKHRMSLDQMLLNNSTIYIHDIKKNTIIDSLNSDVFDGAIRAVTVSNDSKIIAIGGRKNIFIRNIEQLNDNIHVLSEHSSGVNSIVQTKDNKIIIGSLDRSIEVWNLNIGKCKSIFLPQNGVGTITYSKKNNNIGIIDLHGNIYVTCADCTYIQKSVSTNKQNSIIFPSQLISFSNDGQLLAFIDSLLYREQNVNFSDELFSVSNVIKIINTTDWRDYKTITNLHGLISDIFFSPDDRYLIISITELQENAQTKYIFWDLKLDKKIKEIECNNLMFSTEGDYVIIEKMDTLYFNKYLGNLNFLLINTLPGLNGPIIFNKNNIFFSDYKNNYIRILTLDGKETNSLKGHKLYSHTFEVDTINNRIYSSGWDCQTKIWDTKSGKELLTIIALDSTDWAVVAPDGRFDASPYGMKLLYYVQGLEVLPLESFFEKYYTPGLLKQILDNPDNQTEQRGPVDFRKTLRLPPKVAISSNITEMSTDQTQARIFLQVSDAGGGIDEVRLYQNGKLLPRELMLDKKTTQIGRKQEITYSVPLVSGKNEFKATGFNIDRTESIPVNLVVNRNAVESSINLYLMAIGVNTYKNAVYNLTYAKPDAETFVRKVEEASSALFKSIYKYEFYDSNATRTNIENTISAITSSARPEDVFVFYFAGHGVMSEEEDGKTAEFYLIPHDVVKMYGRNDLLTTKGISAAWLRETCAKIRAQKQLVLLDACHSGGAVESFGATRDAATEKAILQLARSAGITILAASGTEQSAAEFGQLGHGVFTYALLEGFDGLADGRKDGKVTVMELKIYLEERVPALALQYRGVEQYPTGFSRGHDFPIGMVKK